MQVNELKFLEHTYEKIFVWGAGNYLLENWGNDFEFEAVIDSSDDKVGKVILGRKIISPSILKEMNLANAAIVIYSVYWMDIINQIRNMEIKGDIILPFLYKKELNWFCKSTFSAWGEDAMISNICRRYGISIEHYMDIGTNHPIGGNETYLFYLQGASGALVEPNPKYMESYKLIRPKDRIYNVGMASKECDGKEKIYYMIEGLDTRNTFSETIARNHEKKGFKISEKSIRLISLNSLMESYGEKVNYISIDVEGLEWDILKDFDFEKYDVDIFNIEKCGENVKNLFIEKNYKLIAETISNWIFIKNGLIDEEAVLSRILNRVKNS